MSPPSVRNHSAFRVSWLLLALALPGTAADPPAASTPSEVNLTVDTARVTGQIDEKIYGHFLEHIYHSCNGGLWGDLIWNRSFEEAQSKPRQAGDDERSPFRHWRIYGPGSSVSDRDKPLNSEVSAHLHALNGETGLEQTPIRIIKGETYRGSIWARGTAEKGLVVRLLNGQKKLSELVLPPPSSEWHEYPIEFKPGVSLDNATLQIGLRGAGDVWFDQISLMPESWRTDGGFRPDLLKAVGDLRPAVIRWPGGSYVRSYRWKHGIGPQARRQANPNAMWDDKDVNSLGTDEYISLCRKTGAQPLIVVNINPYGTYDSRPEYLKDACDWVEYCNGPVTSQWGKLRAVNGHPEPYHVRFWEIDNEVWKMKPEDYVRCVIQFAGAMKKIDPDISIIAGGSGQLGKRWNEGDLAVIGQCADKIDYLSVHQYENPDRFGQGIARAEEFIQSRMKLIASSKNPHLKLFFSEWNAQSTDWRTGLYAGGILNAFERSGGVGMATPALFLRHVSAGKWDNALINFDHKTWFPAPNYVIMKLWRDHYAPQLLGIEGEHGPLNIVATRTAQGDICFLKVVNPSTDTVAVNLKFASPFKPTSATMDIVAPGSLQARNTLENPQAIKATTCQLKPEGSVIRFSMPPLSAAVVSVK